MQAWMLQNWEAWWSVGACCTQEDQPPSADPCEGFGVVEGAAMRAFQAALELRGRSLEPSTNFWQAGGDSLAASLVRSTPICPLTADAGATSYSGSSMRGIEPSSVERPAQTVLGGDVHRRHDVQGCRPVVDGAAGGGLAGSGCRPADGVPHPAVPGRGHAQRGRATQWACWQ